MGMFANDMDPSSVGTSHLALTALNVTPMLHSLKSIVIGSPLTSTLGLSKVISALELIWGWILMSMKFTSAKTCSLISMLPIMRAMSSYFSLAMAPN